MKFVSFDNKRDLELSDCPFCGGPPRIKHIGNNLSKKRTIEIRCARCRVQRTDSTLTFVFDWLEDVAVKNWNQRPVDDGKIRIEVDAEHETISAIAFLNVVEELAEYLGNFTDSPSVVGGVYDELMRQGLLEELE